MKFPKPIRIYGTTRWNPKDIHKWERSQGIKLPPLTGMADVRDLAERFGVSVSTIWRWAAEG